MRTSGSVSCSLMCDSIDTSGLSSQLVQPRRMSTACPVGSLLYSHSTSDEDGALDRRVVYVGRWPDKTASDSDLDLLPYYVLGRLPQPRCRWIARAVLHSELEIRFVLWIGSRSSLTGCGGQGEASGFFDAGNVDVEPLAWLELRPSVTIENNRGVRGRYVECVLLPESKLERFDAIIDGRDGLDGHRVEALVARLGRCSLFMAEACCFRPGARLNHAAQWRRAWFGREEITTARECSKWPCKHYSWQARQGC